MFTPRLCGFTPEINLFTPKLNNFYSTVKISRWTRSVLTLNWPHDVAIWRQRRTQMALTPMRKPEGIPIVGENLFFSLESAESRRVLSPGQTRHFCDFLLQPPHSPVPPHGDPLWPPVCKNLQFSKSGWHVWLIACAKYSSVFCTASWQFQKNCVQITLESIRKTPSYTSHCGAVPNKGPSLTQVHTRTHTTERFMHFEHGPVNVCASLGVGTSVDLS